ncbi:MAG: hypothetical protein M1840_001428 [Geoglossum simile]|nr:MAG: hypothetical protein M1840_001428 [Geoglossum simile]
MDLEDVEAWIESSSPQQQKRKHSVISAMEPDAGSDTGSKRRRVDPRKDVTALNTRLTLISRPPGSQEGLSAESSSVKSRPRSPTRSMADLDSAVPPIVTREIDPDDEARLPQSVCRLRDSVRTYNRLRGALPSCIQSVITSALGNEFAEGFYFSSDERTSDTWLEFWREIQTVRENARLCSSEDKPEPSWGEEVVRPMLNLGIKYWRTARKTDWSENILFGIWISTNALIIPIDSPVAVGAENLTTAAISPQLAPKDARGCPFEFKKVDYGMFLALDPDSSQLIKERLQWLDFPDKSVNQTMAGYLRNKPLVMFMELKKANPGVNPVVQLGICASALLSRLNRLSHRDKTDFLPLPILQVVGHEWKVYYLHYSASEGVMLRGPEDIGSTLKRESMFQIIRVLGAIADYAVDEYWPWFKSNILQSSALHLDEGGEETVWATTP